MKNYKKDFYISSHLFSEEKPTTLKYYNFRKENEIMTCHDVQN